MSKHFEIRKEVVLETTPEQVWHAIATQEGRTAWSPDPDQPMEGMVVEAEENKRLAVRTPEAENRAFHAFEYLVSAGTDGTTTLTFGHTRYVDDCQDVMFDIGDWTALSRELYLHTQAKYFEHNASRCHAFATWQRYAASDGAEASAIREKAL